MKLHIDRSLVRERLSSAIDLLSLGLGQLDRVGFPCALFVCAIVGASMTQPALGKDSVVPGTSNWRYVFRIMHDDVSGRAIGVTHSVELCCEAKPLDFKLKFSCDGFGSTEGMLTPSDPELDLHFYSGRGTESFMHIERSEGKVHVGKLDIRVDSKPPMAGRAVVWRSHYPQRSPKTYLVRFPVFGNHGDAQSLVEYMKGGSEMIVRLRGRLGHQDEFRVHKLNIAGFDLAYDKISKECVDRQQLLYERVDPFEWTPGAKTPKRETE